MLRIARLTLILTTLVILMALPATTTARIDDWQRVVRARHASATFSQLDGCDLLEVYVSASDGKYVNRHGPVNKQGLLGVLVIVRDACAEPGPKGYPVIYSADGMTLDRLGTSPSFGRAWIDATLAGSNALADPVELGITLIWAPTADFERSRVSGHGWFPPGEKHGARVNTFSHGLMAPAAAWGTLWVDGTAISLEPTHDAVLEQVRYRCTVIQHPRGGADVDC